MIWTVLGTVAIVLASVGIGLVVDRKWRVTPRELAAAGAPRPKLPAHGPGEAPETALRVSADERARLIARQRCGVCEAATEAGDDDRVTYDGRELHVTRFTCTRCATTHSIYFAVVE